MAELQTTREVYLLTGGMTGTDRLFYPFRLIALLIHGCLHLCAPQNLMKIVGAIFGKMKISKFFLV